MTECSNQGCAEGPRCPQHSFGLRPLLGTVYFKRPLEVDLCPLPVADSDRRVEILPRFLDDGKFYTPAFVMELEKEELQRRDTEEQNNFAERIRREKPSSNDLRLPRPYANRKHCYICREPYNDYLEHTNHKQHLHRLRTDRYRNRISELCKSFYPTHFIEKNRKNKPRNSNRPSERHDDQVEEKDLQPPRKESLEVSVQRGEIFVERGDVFVERVEVFVERGETNHERDLNVQRQEISSQERCPMRRMLSLGSKVQSASGAHDEDHLC